jgi:hypothetical protein
LECAKDQENLNLKVSVVQLFQNEISLKNLFHPQIALEANWQIRNRKLEKEEQGFSKRKIMKG